VGVYCTPFSHLRKITMPFPYPYSEGEEYYAPSVLRQMLPELGKLALGFLAKRAANPRYAQRYPLGAVARAALPELGPQP